MYVAKNSTSASPPPPPPPPTYGVDLPLSLLDFIIDLHFKLLHDYTVSMAVSVALIVTLMLLFLPTIEHKVPGRGIFFIAATV